MRKISEAANHPQLRTEWRTGCSPFPNKTPMTTGAPSSEHSTPSAGGASSILLSQQGRCLQHQWLPEVIPNQPASLVPGWLVLLPTWQEFTVTLRMPKKEPREPTLALRNGILEFNSASHTDRYFNSSPVMYGLWCPWTNSHFPPLQNRDNILTYMAWTSGEIMASSWYSVNAPRNWINQIN